MYLNSVIVGFPTWLFTAKLVLGGSAVYRAGLSVAEPVAK